MPINFYQFIILVVLALVLLGPERLPQYARNLARWTKKARYWAEDAKGRFKDETGTDFDDVDWRKYDPRQYDPRRIIREALSEELDDLDLLKDSPTPRQSMRPSSGKQVDPLELFGAKGNSEQRRGAVAAGVAGAAGTASAAGAASGSAASTAASSSSGGTAAAGGVPYDGEDPLAAHRAPFDAEAT